MRRIWIPLGCALVLAIHGRAHAVTWGVGLQLVGNSHSLTGDLPDDGDWGARFGYGAGATVELAFTDDVAVALQPTYTVRGFRQTFQSNGVVLQEIDYDLEYAAIPLLVRVSSDPRRVRGFVTAGFTFSWLLEAHSESENERSDVSGQFKDFSLGALFGAGSTIRIGSNLLVLELRYEQGLDDIGNTTGSEQLGGDDSSSVKYREFRLQAGFVFNFGGGK